MPTKREDIVVLRNRGLTLREIGKNIGVSSERVRQILSGNNNNKNKRKPPLKIDQPLSTGDVARMLNIHSNTVRRWSHLGILKMYRIGSRGDRRFKRSDVQRIMKIDLPPENGTRYNIVKGGTNGQKRVHTGANHQ